MDSAVPPTTPAKPAPIVAPGSGDPVPAPLAGNIFKIVAKEGQEVTSGDVVIIMEAMKMETEVRAPRGGTVTQIRVKEGEAVQVGNTLLLLS